MNARTNSALFLTLKLALLVAFLVGSNVGVHRRITAIGWHSGLVVFASVWMIAGAALLLLAFSPNRGARLFWTVPLVVCSFVGFTFHAATATFMKFIAGEPRKPATNLLAGLL